MNMSGHQYYSRGASPTVEDRWVRQSRNDGDCEIFLRRKDIDPDRESLLYLRRCNLRERPRYTNPAAEDATRWNRDGDDRWLHHNDTSNQNEEACWTNRATESQWCKEDAGASHWDGDTRWSNRNKDTRWSNRNGESRWTNGRRWNRNEDGRWSSRNENSKWANQAVRAPANDVVTDRRNQYEKMDYIDERKLKLPTVGDHDSKKRAAEEEARRRSTDNVTFDPLMGFEPPTFIEEQKLKRPPAEESEGSTKAKRGKKYSWDEIMVWEQEEYGYAKHFPPHINEIYQAGLKIKFKHPVQLLYEYCQKNVYKPPEYCLVYNGPNKNRGYMFKVVVNGRMFQSDYYSQNKKQAKVYGALKALWELGETRGLS